jgi:predicted amidophosphoribosyltransferase
VTVAAAKAQAESMAEQVRQEISEQKYDVNEYTQSDDLRAGCPKCGASLKPKAKFCSECGTAIKAGRFCSECGSEMESNAKFCSGCGAQQ